MALIQILAMIVIVSSSDSSSSSSSGDSGDNDDNKAKKVASKDKCANVNDKDSGTKSAEGQLTEGLD